LTILGSNSLIISKLQGIDYKIDNSMEMGICR